MTEKPTSINSGNPLHRQLSWTAFPDRTAKSQKRHANSLSEMADIIRSTHRSTKERLPWQKFGLYGDVPSARGCLRTNVNFSGFDAIELDYDDGGVGWDQGWCRLYEARISALLYTSARHTEAKPRFRIIIPVSRLLPPFERKRLVARAYGVVRGILDPASFTPSQAFNFGSASHVRDKKDGPLRRGVSVRTELVNPPGGRFIDLADDLDALALGRDGEPFQDRDERIRPDSRKEADIDRVRSILAAIPADRWDDDYGEWLKAGMAVHDECEGSYAGLELWDQASQRCLSYDYDELSDKWESFGGCTGELVRLGSMIRIAKTYGWTDPGATEVELLNERHALVMVQGRALIATEHDDGGTDFGTVRDMHALYANRRVAVTDKRSEAISERWMRSPARRTYPEGVAFAPDGTTIGKLNLWRGWAMEPDSKASCALLLNHVREVICDGNQLHYNYIIGWLAQMVQRPHEKPGVALVLRGLKGTGKDSVADYVARMIGRHHAPTVSQSEHIVGRFNRRLENALLLHVQEGSWAGDPKAEQVLKYIITSEFVEIERKGIDSINVRSVVRLFISANADWVVPASPDERRFAILEVSDARKGDKAYWDAFHAEKDGEGPAALLHFLRQYDLSSFDVRSAPNTEGLSKQKLASLRGIHGWWYEVLYVGAIGNLFDDNDWHIKPISIARDELRLSYMQHMGGRRFENELLDSAKFGEKLHEMLPGIDDRRPRKSGTRVREYILPVLSVAREQFVKWFGSPLIWNAEI